MTVYSLDGESLSIRIEKQHIDTSKPNYEIRSDAHAVLHNVDIGLLQSALASFCFLDVQADPQPALIIGNLEMSQRLETVTQVSTSLGQPGNKTAQISQEFLEKLEASLRAQKASPSQDNSPKI